MQYVFRTKQPTYYEAIREINRSNKEQVTRKRPLKKGKPSIKPNTVWSGSGYFYK